MFRETIVITDHIKEIIFRVWTVTEKSTGVTASCTQLITVKDTTAPTFTCPQDQ